MQSHSEPPAGHMTTPMYSHRCQHKSNPVVVDDNSCRVNDGLSSKAHKDSAGASTTKCWCSNQRADCQCWIMLTAWHGTTRHSQLCSTGQALPLQRFLARLVRSVVSFHTVWMQLTCVVARSHCQTMLLPLAISGFTTMTYSSEAR